MAGWTSVGGIVGGHTETLNGGRARAGLGSRDPEAGQAPGSGASSACRGETAAGNWEIEGEVNGRDTASG